MALKLRKEEGATRSKAVLLCDIVTGMTRLQKVTEKAVCERTACSRRGGGDTPSPCPSS